MVRALPLGVTSILSSWHLRSLLVLGTNFPKLSFDWHGITALAEMWHPQTHTFIFPSFEATLPLEEVEAYFSFPRSKVGEEDTICHTVAPIDAAAIFSEFIPDQGEVRAFVGPRHVHLLPLSQWVIAHCKNKCGWNEAIAKAASICLCGAILFPSVDHVMDLPILSTISGLWRGLFISQAVLAYLYEGLSSAALGGPLFGSMILLECWMGVRLKFSPRAGIETASRIFGSHPLSFIGNGFRFPSQVECRTSELKTREEWRRYLGRLPVERFVMRPSFLVNTVIRLPRGPGLDLRLVSDTTLAVYCPHRCFLQVGMPRTLLPPLSHFPSLQARQIGSEQDEESVRSALVMWGISKVRTLPAEVEEATETRQAYIRELREKCLRGNAQRKTE